METPTLKCPRSGRLLTPLSMDYWRLKSKLNRVLMEISDSEDEDDVTEQTPMKNRPVLQKSSGTATAVKNKGRLTPRARIVSSNSSEGELPPLDARCKKTPDTVAKPRLEWSPVNSNRRATPKAVSNSEKQAESDDDDDEPVVKPRARRRAQKFTIASSSSSTSSDDQENREPDRTDETALLSRALASTRIDATSPVLRRPKTPTAAVIEIISDDDDNLAGKDERIKTNRRTPTKKTTTKEAPRKLCATEPTRRVLKDGGRQEMMPPPSVPTKKLTKRRPEPPAKVESDRRGGGGGGGGGGGDDNDDSVAFDDLLEKLREQKHDDDDYDESQVDLNNSVCEWEKINAEDRNFLKSLDEDIVPLKFCHKDALKYRKAKFNSIRDELVKKLFDLYHRTVFQNRFESEIPVTWNVRMVKTAGFCYYRRHTGGLKSARIELAPKVLDRPVRLRDTLLHEMCHAGAWLIHGYRDGHGPLFKFWGQRAYQLLGLTVTTTHSYQIETKYIYRCQGCANQVGRHSKSLDTSKFICRICKGRFELFVNNKQRNQVTPVAERKPSPFSNFVRDEYRTVKAGTPHLSHREVMSVLSDRWKKLKNSA